ncbi:MAG: tetratricopeptide repeat protein [Bacteroidales bacterium]|nr:tetratricopeptide repeat protein [Bacteroidales bacterium]
MITRFWPLLFVLFPFTAFPQSPFDVSMLSGDIKHHPKLVNLRSLGLISEKYNLDFQEGLVNWHLAWALYHDGYLEDAEENISRAFNSIRHHPDLVSKLYCFRGIIRFERGSFADARNDLVMAVQIDPVYALAWEYLARVCLEQGLLDECLQYIANAIALQKDNSAVTSNLLHMKGWIYYQKGKLDEALDCFSSALILDQTNPELWWSLGGVFGDKKEFDRAVDAYSTALWYVDDDSLDLAALYHWRGYFRISAGDLTGAIRDLHKAIEVYPEYGQAMWNIGYAFECSNLPDSAVIFLRKALPYYQNDSLEFPMLLNTLGYNLCLAGNAQEGSVYLEMAYKMSPDDGLIQWNLGYANGQLKHYNIALRFYRKAFDSYREDRLKQGKILSSIGFYECENGQIQKGIENLENAIRLNPDFQQAYYNLMSAYTTSGSWKELESLCSISRKKWETDIRFQKAVAEYLFRGYISQNEQTKAMQSLTEALKYDSSASYMLARLHLECGQADSARYFFQTALRYPPSDSSSFPFSLFFLGDTTNALTFQLRLIERCPDCQKKRTMLYNMACLYSLAGDAVNAVFYIQLALDNGYDNILWIRNDPDLYFVRRSREFRKLSF